MIANARITATSTERGNTRNAAANDKGAWILTPPPIGTYSLKIEAPGFKSFNRQAIALGAEDNLKIDAALEVGNTSDTITVTAEAPQVDSRSSTLGATIDSRTLLDMPLDGRNIFDLTTLLPVSPACPIRRRSPTTARVPRLLRPARAPRRTT